MHVKCGSFNQRIDRCKKDELQRVKIMMPFVKCICYDGFGIAFVANNKFKLTSRRVNELTSYNSPFAAK
jgi:hypothetical protein